MSEDEEKVKLRRLEPAIQKFTKIVIPTDLERLKKHQINIEKVSIPFLPQKQVPCGFLLAICISANSEAFLRHLRPADTVALLFNWSSSSTSVILLYSFFMLRKGDKDSLCLFNSHAEVLDSN